MLDDDVERRLRALGDRHAPAPRARFVDELGYRLAIETPHRRSRPPVSRLLAPVLSAAAAVIVTLLITDPRTPQVQTVRMASSIGDVEIVRPDGSVVAAQEGMTIEDGSLIRVRNGRAEVGGVILGSGEVAEVDNGVVQPTITSMPTTSAAPTTQAPTTTAPATTSTAPPATTAASPSTSTTSPPSTIPPSTTSTTRPEPEQMRFSARYNARGEVVLQWSGYTGTDFGSYVVLRSEAPNPPTAPGRDGTEAILRTTDQRALFFVDHPPIGMQPVYRVVALDRRERAIVARTFAIRPQPPATQQRTTASAPAASEPVATQPTATQPVEERPASTTLPPRTVSGG